MSIETPNETGYYHHTNGNGGEEVVYLDFNAGSYWVNKFNGDTYPLNDDKGIFGDRIELASERYY